mgnify:CR=1 FL=1
MRARTLVAAIVATAFAGGGLLYAQPGSSNPGDAAKPPSPGSAAPADDDPDLSLPADKNASLTPTEMSDNADSMIDEMEKIHRQTLELKAAATKSKDVIKLNCVQEEMLAVKQLLNIAEQAKTDLTEAKVQGDRAEQQILA